MKLPVWFNRTNLYYFGLALMIAALPLSKYVMSMAQMGLTLNWLIDPRILDKWKAFFKNKPAMAITGIFVFHIIGLIWTTDFDYAAKDLRTKLPLLALPIIISTSPKVGRKLFHYLLLLFIAANVAGSGFSIHKLLTEDIVEIRKISMFMSHIRFSLNICVAIFSGFYLIFVSKFFKRNAKLFILLLVIWLLIFLVILESITGITIILITSGILAIRYITNSKQPIIKYALIAVLIAVPTLLFFYIRGMYLDYMPDKPLIHDGLEKTTRLGNPYTHDTTFLGADNGNWTGQYIQIDELRKAWYERSSVQFYGKNKSGHLLYHTLIRFLTSKGLRKDADGVAALSDEEIQYIENGIASINQVSESNLKNRLKTMIWEITVYRQSGYMSGNSLTQRLEFLRAGSQIIKNNFWLGTGTGDISQAFQDEYNKLNSQLKSQFRWRTHNQYVSIMAALGIFGFLWFMFALIYPAWKLKMFSDYYYFVFFCILMLSMLSEDTIENQAGVTFFAFFTSFFLFARRDEDKAYF
jgi:hypothetical protein